MLHATKTGAKFRISPFSTYSLMSNYLLIKRFKSGNNFQKWSIAKFLDFLSCEYVSAPAGQLKLNWINFQNVNAAYSDHWIKQLLSAMKTFLAPNSKLYKVALCESRSWSWTGLALKATVLHFPFSLFYDFRRKKGGKHSWMNVRSKLISYYGAAHRVGEKNLK